MAEIHAREKYEESWKRRLPRGKEARKGLLSFPLAGIKIGFQETKEGDDKRTREERIYRPLIQTKVGLQEADFSARKPTLDQS